MIISTWSFFTTQNGWELQRRWVKVKAGNGIIRQEKEGLNVHLVVDDDLSGLGQVAEEGGSSLMRLWGTRRQWGLKTSFLWNIHIPEIGFLMGPYGVKDCHDGIEGSHKTECVSRHEKSWTQLGEVLLRTKLSNRRCWFNPPALQETLTSLLEDGDSQ